MQTSAPVSLNLLSCALCQGERHRHLIPGERHFQEWTVFVYTIWQIANTPFLEGTLCFCTD